MRSAQGHSEQRAGRSAAGGGQGSRERVDAGGWRHVGEGAKVDERGEEQPPRADAAAMELEVAGLDRQRTGPTQAAAGQPLTVASLWQWRQGNTCLQHGATILHLRR